MTRNLLPVQEAVPEGQVILGDVDTAVVSFYDGNGWTENWDSAESQTLPAAIRLSIARISPGGAQGASAPIEIVVPVMVRTTTSQTQEAEDMQL